MPTNANLTNSRVTSEALEEKFRQVFPSQGGAELVQDLYASGVIQPVIDFSTVAEGSVLAPNLQIAWDFATGADQVTSTTYVDIVTTPGFWLVDLTYAGLLARNDTNRQNANVDIYDGATSKPIWGISNLISTGSLQSGYVEGKFVAFLRAGDAMRARVQAPTCTMDIWYRQIADVNGNLVNPLGFTFS